jgi:hypothetical protein
MRSYPQNSDSSQMGHQPRRVNLEAWIIGTIRINESVQVPMTAYTDTSQDVVQHRWR